MSNRNCYTYLIGWSKFNIWYYGAKYGKNADPSTFWINYFTSSKHVKKFVAENGQPDIIQIRKVFGDNPNQCIDWEHRVLKRIKVIKLKNWLNESNGVNHYARTKTEEHIRKVLETRKRNNKPNNRKGQKLSKQHRLRIGKSNTGKPGWNKGKHWSQEVKDSISMGNTGKHHTEETKNLLSEITIAQFSGEEGELAKQLRRDFNEEAYKDPERRKQCGNGSRGRIWIHDDLNNSRMIIKESTEYNLLISLGWKIGRNKFK